MVYLTIEDCHSWNKLICQHRFGILFKVKRLIFKLMKQTLSVSVSNGSSIRRMLSNICGNGALLDFTSTFNPACIMCIINLLNYFKVLAQIYFIPKLEEILQLMYKWCFPFLWNCSSISRWNSARSNKSRSTQPWPRRRCWSSWPVPPVSDDC